MISSEEEYEEIGTILYWFVDPLGGDDDDGRGSISKHDYVKDNKNSIRFQWRLNK